MKLMLLLTIFVTCMSFVNVVSAKLFDVAGLTVSAGIIAYWLTFPVTDVVGEVFGRRTALQFVGLGLLTNILIVLLTQAAVALPPSPFYTNQAELAVVLGSVPLIVLASLTAYFLAQINDVLVFDWVKRLTSGRMLWLRNNASTMSSQLIDSLVFNGIAFYLFAEEKMPLEDFIAMTVGYWLFKVGIAIIDTPIVYLLVAWFRRSMPVKERTQGSS
ncbi:MAG: putative integral membrane protein (TIGR00697 family) [Candidatus Azotimanducaceae bacterium]|jgi:uncharacterized integral membrane protein (TIGR00697 family)